MVLYFFCPKHSAYIRVALIQVNTVMLSINLVCLKSLDSTGQENPKLILGNPSQEPVLHIGNSHIFLKKKFITFPLNFHDSRRKLKKSQA